jgi:hypothetical protein
MSGPLERYANEDLQLSRWSGQEFLPGWEFVAAERAVTFAATNAIRLFPSRKAWFFARP